MNSVKAVDWILVVLINFMWATQVLAIRFIGERLSPVTVALIPLLISTMLFLPALWIQNRKRNANMLWKWKDIKYFILPGVIGIFVMQYAYTLGATLTLAANAGIITLTIPVLVAVFASLLLKEKLNFIRIASFVLAIIGVLMASVSDVAGADFKEVDYLAGNLIFLFACCCCAFYNTYCKMLIDKNYTELEVLVYSSIIGSLVSIPVLLWIEPFNINTFLQSGWVVILSVFELSFIVYGISMLLFFYVLKRMDVTQAVLGNYLLPFFIALLGILLLGEKITTVMYVSAAFITISTLMVTVYEKRLQSFISKNWDMFKYKLKNSRK